MKTNKVMNRGSEKEEANDTKKRRTKEKSTWTKNIYLPSRKDRP